MVCICTMVKNESKVIKRMLDSCLILKGTKLEIKSLCLTDTGSADGTQDIAIKWGKENNIDTKICEVPWVNFGVSRTDSLLNAYREYPNENYYLLIDGDMVLKIKNNEELKKDLTCNSYLVEQKNGPSSYYNTRLISGKAKYRCIGSTHEYWGDIDSPGREKFDGIYFEDLNDGGSRSDKNQRDIRLLLEGMRNPITPNYLQERYAYYLGQSYEGIGDFDNSDRWFREKVRLGGWDEEVFYSLYKIAENAYRRSLSREGEEKERYLKESISLYLESWNYRPRRAEPLYGVVRSARLLGMKNVALMFITIGVQIPRPGDILFINEGVYNGTLFNEEKAKLE